MKVRSLARGRRLTRYLSVVGLLVALPLTFAPTAVAVNTVVDTITIGGIPGPVVMNPNGNRVYVANAGGSNISVIHTSTNALVRTITVGFGPQSMAISPDGTTLYVVNWNSRTISVVDTETNTVIAEITPPGIFPDLMEVAVTSDGSKFLVSDLQNNKLLIYSTSTGYALLAAVTTGVGPLHIVVSPDASTAYVANTTGQSLTVVNLTSYATTTIPLGTLPLSVAVSPDGSRIYVGHFDAPQLQVIDTADNTVETTINTGNAAWELAVTDSVVYAATKSGDPTRSVITPVQVGSWNVGSTIPVGTNARLVLINPDGSMGYSFGAGTATVTSFSTTTNEVIASIPVGVSPGKAVFTPDGSRLYVVSAIGTVTVIDTYVAPTRDTSMDPHAAIQQFAVPSGTLAGECASLAPDSVNWPGLIGMHAQGWGISHAQWPNGGAGGSVCSRQPVWLGSGWGFSAS